MRNKVYYVKEKPTRSGRALLFSENEFPERLLSLPLAAAFGGGDTGCLGEFALCGRDAEGAFPTESEGHTISLSFLVYALLAGGQAHADGSGVRGLPIGAAVTIAVVVILAAGAGDVDGLGRLGSGEHRCGGGAVPIHVQAQGIGDGAKRQINRAVNGEWLHGLTVGIDETYVLAIKCDAHVVIVYFFCDLAHGGGGGAMGLSSGHSAGRRRFTIAHELGHLLLNHKGDLINREPSPGDNPVEREANIFAARLLRRIASCGVWIPATQGSISELCNISYQAAEFRAKRISLLMGDRQSMQERGRPYFLQSPVEEKLYMQVLPYIKTHKAPLLENRLMTKGSCPPG